MSILAGFVMVFFAGSIMGTTLVPLKWIRAWKWENFWFVYSIMSLLIVPFCIAFHFVPHLAVVYASIPLSTMAKPFFYGVLWGVAQLGAGICVDKIGLALTGSILNGLCAALGTLTPLVLLHFELLSKPSGQLLLAGTAVMLLGVALCGWAGYQREKTLPLLSGTIRSGKTYILVMILCGVSGFLAALLNIALAFGGDIIQLARALGTPTSWAVFAVWPIALLGGLVVNLGYSVYLLIRNKTWGNFAANPLEMGAAILGGSIWMIAIAIYSSGTVYLGVLGVSAGWALFNIALILSANLGGLLTGEWKSVGRRIFNVNVAGVVVLLVATIVMAAANYSAH
jgi:L-rhamnose-H+ transport protein